MTFALETQPPSAEQFARARVIAAEYPGVCDPVQVEACGIAEDGERISACRCLEEAMESGSA